MAADAFLGGGVYSAARSEQAFDLLLNMPPMLLQQPAAAQAQIMELVRDTFLLIMTDAGGRLSESAPVGVSGNLAASFVANPASPDGGIEISGSTDAEISGRVFSALPYAIVMNDGRRAGAPISRQGIDAIGLWAERKLGMSPEQAAHAKFAIAKSIIAHGIEGKRFVEEVFAQGQPRWQGMLDDLASDIIAALTGGDTPAPVVSNIAYGPTRRNAPRPRTASPPPAVKMPWEHKKYQPRGKK